jgi:hypothetical protein
MRKVRQSSITTCLKEVYALHSILAEKGNRVIEIQIGNLGGGQKDRATAIPQNAFHVSLTIPASPKSLITWLVSQIQHHCNTALSHYPPLVLPAQFHLFQLRS